METSLILNFPNSLIWYTLVQGVGLGFFLTLGNVFFMMNPTQHKIKITRS